MDTTSVPSWSTPEWFVTSTESEQGVSQWVWIGVLSIALFVIILLAFALFTNKGNGPQQVPVPQQQPEVPRTLTSSTLTPVFATPTALSTAPPSGSGTNRLVSPGRLYPGEFLVNGQFKLIAQTDGNIVLYKGTAPIWESRTMGAGINFFTMQNDGNVVAYDKNGTAYWSNKGDRFKQIGPFTLVLNDDGNLTVRTPTDILPF